MAYVVMYPIGNGEAHARQAIYSVAAVCDVANGGVTEAYVA